MLTLIFWAFAFLPFFPGVSAFFFVMIVGIGLIQGLGAASSSLGTMPVNIGRAPGGKPRIARRELNIWRLIKTPLRELGRVIIIIFGCAIAATLIAITAVKMGAV